MKRVVLPGTDLALSRLSFGTASLHHLSSRRKRIALLESALECGITHFDTAPSYGFGLSELELGRAFARRRGEVTIATKFGLYSPGAPVAGTPALWLRKGLGKLSARFSRPLVDWSTERAARSLRESLERLRTDYVDILFLHEPTGETLRSDAAWRWLEAERKLGTVRAWGMSGEASEIATATTHPLAMVLQVRDSIESVEADAVVRAGRVLQLTFGYLSASTRRAAARPATAILEAALLRNRTGSVLVSTRRAERLTELAGVVARSPA